MNKVKVAILITFLSLTIFAVIRGNSTNSEVARLSDQQSSSEGDLDELQEILGKIKPATNSANTNVPTKRKERGIFIPLHKKSNTDVKAIISARKKILRIKKSYGFYISQEEELTITDLALISLGSSSLEDVLHSPISHKDLLYSENGGKDWLQQYYVQKVLGQGKPVLNQHVNNYGSNQDANDYDLTFDIDRAPSSYCEPFEDGCFNPDEPTEGNEMIEDFNEDL